MHPDNTAFAAEGGVLYSADGGELIWCSPAAEGTLRIPDGVEKVRTQSFADAHRLERLEIPEALEVPTDLIGYCPNLIDVAVPEGNPTLMRVGPLLCSRSAGSVVMCMRNAEGRVEIPEGVRALTECAFAACRGVTEVILPDSLGYIMTEAFRDCTGLTTLTIPSSVSMIANQVFDGCTSLKDIYYQGTEEAWQSMTERFDLGLPENVTIHFE